LIFKNLALVYNSWGLRSILLFFSLYWF